VNPGLAPIIYEYIYYYKICLYLLSIVFCVHYRYQADSMRGGRLRCSRARTRGFAGRAGSTVVRAAFPEIRRLSHSADVME
jgi:hypothetical protein